MKRIGVLGAGTWGMALARMLCNAGNEVMVWSAVAAEIDTLSSTRMHPNLPGVELPDRWVVGVQWHPELTAAEDPEQQAIFDAFVAECARRR